VNGCYQAAWLKELHARSHTCFISFSTFDAPDASKIAHLALLCCPDPARSATPMTSPMSKLDQRRPPSFR
jgi:hypothetical protein